MSQKYSKQLNWFAIAILIFQIFILLMYGFFVRVDTTISKGYLENTYPWYQDINVMILIGFGYLLAVIKTYGWSALGFTFFINAFVVQQYLLLQGFWQKVFISGFEHKTIILNMKNLMYSSFASAAVLISFGGVLGRVGPFELLVMALIQTVGYSLNERIIYGGAISTIDYGGSMAIHTFGAYFGLVTSYIIGRKIKISQQKKPVADYLSCIFAIFGTIFLWLYWPSFNSGIVPYEGTYQRLITITNTILCLTGSCISSFALSIILRGRFSMDDILNTTLAGGVAMGSSCSIITNPATSIAVGVAAGFVSTYGFARLSQMLSQHYGIYDTVGIHNLHGMPGIIGGLTSAVILTSYNTNPLNIGNATLDFVGHNYIYQSGIQVAGTFISLGIAVVFGMIAGFVINSFYHIQSSDFFEDEIFWEIPQKEISEKNNKQPKDSKVKILSKQDIQLERQQNNAN